MLRFIIWMIVVYIAAKIIGTLIRSIRLYFTPNKDVFSPHSPSPLDRQKKIEDIPYEEIKDPE